MDPRLGIVTGRTTAANRGRGTQVRLLQVMITDLTDVQTVQLIEQSGEESSPLNGTLVVVLPGGLAFKLGVAAGDGVTPVMDPGGKRIYALDPATAQPIAELRLLPDGTIRGFNSLAESRIDPDGTMVMEGPVGSLVIDPDGKVTVDNGAASITMNADGTFVFHGTQATFDCPVVVPSLAMTYPGGSGVLTGTTATMDTDVTADGISLHDHTHPGVQTGTGDTGAPQ